MPTKEELEAENADLRAANEKLRSQLDDVAMDDAGAARVPTPNTRPKPTEPSYGISEGQRAELEMTGKTVSPFTGARQVGDGEPGADPDVVDQETFDKTKSKLDQKSKLEQK